MAKMQLLTPKKRKAQLPLFVFLPGMDGSGQLLYRQMAGLEAGLDIRCLSLPVDDLSNWDSLVEQVVELIAAELGNETRPIHLCGESFGGCLAMKVTAAQPSLFESLTLVNPASSFSRIPLFQFGSPLSNLLPDPLYKFASSILGQFLVEMERVTPDDCQALNNAMLGVSPTTAAWRLHLLRQFNLNTVGLKALSLPVLLIAGGRDRLLPSAQEVSRISRQLPNAQTCLLPNSGHACLLEQEVNLGEILQQQGVLSLKTL